MPSGLTWADSFSYLVYISLYAFWVCLSHITHEKALQGYHVTLVGWELVNVSQDQKLWLSPCSRNPALPEGMHIKVRTERKILF